MGIAYFDLKMDKAKATEGKIFRVIYLILFIESYGRSTVAVSSDYVVLCIKLQKFMYMKLRWIMNFGLKIYFFLQS